MSQVTLSGHVPGNSKAGAGCPAEEVRASGVPDGQIGPFAGKAAVITGADSGIGKAVAIAFARGRRRAHFVPDRA